jgi:DUF1680 family protein
LDKISRRHFVASAAAAVASAALPRSVFAAQDPVVNAVAGHESRAASRDSDRWQAIPFPMKNVRLGAGAFRDAADANRRYLKSLPPDRLLHTFRLTAGLPSSAEPLGDWEKPDCELRGHFAGGHYLSACAMAFASSGDEELKRNGDLVVAELAKCQAKLKTGYLSAFPVELFDRLRDGVNVWAPYYTLHKIIAGHIDMYTLAGNAQALETAEKIAGWVGSWAGPLSDQHMQRVLNVEFGGMSESLCNLYALTGKREYLELSERFHKKSFYDPLAARRDELKGLHANTHIPQVIAAARYYELTGDKRYHTIAEFFWNEVTSQRCYCTGGTSNDEFWHEPGVLSSELGPLTAEDCCAYNMMKLTRHIFGWSPEARVMDYYERTLLNHRMGTIDPESGTTVYYLPHGNGFTKIYAKPFDSFWCCSGTCAEEFAKLTDTIYFHDEDSVYVNLFMASELSWPEKGLRLRQETQFPDEQGTTLVVSSADPVDLDLKLRIPYWTTGGEVKINGRRLSAFANPSSYLVLRGPWNNGDRIELSLPMRLHAAPTPDNERIQAAMFGPMVLAARSEQEPRDNWYRHFRMDEKKAAAPMLKISGKAHDPSSWLEAAPGKLTFRTVGQKETATLAPLARIVHERYAVYHEVTGA